MKRQDFCFLAKNAVRHSFSVGGQVFFFLLIFSCSVQAMERLLAISRVTSEQIVYALKSYSDMFPQFVNKEKMETEIKRISETDLTLEDKKEIIEKMEQFPRPKIANIGERIIVFERSDSYESKSHDSLS